MSAGDSEELLARHNAMVAEIPSANMRLHLCLRATDGIVLVDTIRRVSEMTACLDCDEKGPPRWHAQLVIEERARGGPFSCCTLDWI
jgi:hypothetical protein